MSTFDEKSQSSQDGAAPQGDATFNSGTVVNAHEDATSNPNGGHAEGAASNGIGVPLGEGVLYQVVQSDFAQAIEVLNNKINELASNMCILTESVAKLTPS